MTRLTFTPGNHTYRLTDESGRSRRVPSVTGLLSQLDKPALKRWAANTAADYATDHWDDLANLPPSKRRSTIAAAPWQKRDKAAAKGTAIHALAEDLIAGKPVDVPGDLAGQVQGLARWLEASGFTATDSECMVWSDDDEDLGLTAYAGTFDAFGTHPRHGSMLLDWKTGSGVYSDYGVQLAAYATADWVVTDGDDMAMPRPDTLAVAHIRPDGTDLHLLTPDQVAAAVQRFELLRMLHLITQPEFRMEATA